MALLARSAMLLIVCAMISGSSSSNLDGKFHPCQGTRKLNSLESMKAQGLATRIGAKCVGQHIVQFISKHRIPTFAFPKLADAVCRVMIVAYGNFATKDLILAKGTSADDLAALIKSLYRILETNPWILTHKKSGQKYVVPAAEIAALGLEQLECVMKLEKTPIKDANLILYSINQMQRLLAKQ